MAEPVEQEAAQGHVLAFGQVDVQTVPHVVDAHPAVGEPTAPVHPHHLGLVVGVELVGQVADQGSEQVLDREYPFDATVLVVPYQGAYSFSTAQEFIRPIPGVHEM